MKILLLILHAEAGRGAERYTRDLANHMLGLGHSVTTAAASFDSDWPGEHQLVPTPGLTRTARYRAYLANTDRLVTDQQRRGGETAGDRTVVHAMLPVRRADLYHPHAGIAGLRKRSSVAEYLNRRRQLMARTELELLTGASPPLTIALSNYVLGHLRSVYPTAPATILLNGVDTARFDPTLYEGHRPTVRRQWGITDGDLALLCVAQDFARKGVGTAIQALRELPELTKLIVVGRDNPEPMRKLAQSLKLADRVIFPGPAADTRPAYASADLFVLPTHHDPCPLVTLEALAMGLPVLSTVFNGSTEYMTDGVHGAILPTVDARLLATAIQAYLDPAVRGVARQACLAMRPTLDSQSHWAALQSLYQTISVKR